MCPGGDDAAACGADTLCLHGIHHPGKLLCGSTGGAGSLQQPGGAHLGVCRGAVGSAIYTETWRVRRNCRGKGDSESWQWEGEGLGTFGGMLPAAAERGCSGGDGIEAPCDSPTEILTSDSEDPKGSLGPVAFHSGTLHPLCFCSGHFCVSSM